MFAMKLWKVIGDVTEPLLYSRSLDHRAVHLYSHYVKETSHCEAICICMDKLCARYTTFYIFRLQYFVSTRFYPQCPAYDYIAHLPDRN